MQENPEARSYYNRALPNVNDLFQIYGNRNPDAGHNVDDVDPIFGYNKGLSLSHPHISLLVFKRVCLMNADENVG